VKARDVRAGDTVMCCQSSIGHTPRPVRVTRILTAPGTKRIAFAYDDDQRNGKGPGITASYQPGDDVATPRPA
jgi:hypothetical protein